MIQKGVHDRFEVHNDLLGDMLHAESHRLVPHNVICCCLVLRNTHLVEPAPGREFMLLLRTGLQIAMKQLFQFFLGFSIDPVRGRI